MTSTRKTTIRSITALAAMLTVTAAMAAAGSTPLSECYDLVIASCNEGEHPVPCANNGMDQCDEVYGVQVAGGLVLTTIPPVAAQTRKQMVFSR